MRKILSVLLVAMMFLCISGCDTASEGNTPRIAPDITVHELGQYHRYVIDNRTGVVYLEYTQGGITVMYNSDGSLVTAQQMGLR